MMAATEPKTIRKMLNVLRGAFLDAFRSDLLQASIEGNMPGCLEDATSLSLGSLASPRKSDTRACTP